MHYVNQSKECPPFACTKTYLLTYMKSIDVGIINNLVELYEQIHVRCTIYAVYDAFE